MRRLAPALLLAAALGAGPRAAAAERRLVVSFDDPAGDATGPGTYEPPGDTEFQAGDFDLLRFAVYVEGDDAIFEVTLGAPVRAPAVANRTNSFPLELWNGIYLQNVDIYMDADPTPGSGFDVCIPGRRVAFADGRTWEAAVVLTPQPGLARAIAAEALGRAAAHVVFAQGLRSRGRTLVARVPVSALGSLPRRDWGYSVHVSGARWESSYGVAPRVKGSLEANAFTMPVLGVREAWAFGGAPAGEAHPRVVDVLLPPGVDQKAVLGSFDAATGAFARVPFVYAEPPPPGPTATATSMPAASATPTVPLTVVDVVEDMVSISGPVAGLRPMQLGRVLGPDGSTVARIVVIQVLKGGLVASAVDGRERIARGARVLIEGAGAQAR